MDIESVNNYFNTIKSDCNIDNILAVESLTNNKKIELYQYLESNNILYAGGEISEADIEKVRNVMIMLWLKANENNKKYSR